MLRRRVNTPAFRDSTPFNLRASGNNGRAGEKGCDRLFRSAAAIAPFGFQGHRLACYAAGMAVFAKWLTTSAAYGSGARAIALHRSGGCAQTGAVDKPVRRDAVLRVGSQLVQFLAEVDQLPDFIHRDGDP